ncbi:MAG TPA: serine/threonine-protein kinase [Candidatus Xenobia bacterium]|jgi:serine/threonine-protein kinase
MLEPGDVLQSRYVIEELLGAGGMGRVYRAHQSLLGGLPLAIKEINLELVPEEYRTDAIVNFLSEAETVARLSHPNLVGLHDCFEERGRLYLAMDLVGGENLERVLDRHPHGLPVETVLEYARQLCTVLSYLHRSNPPVIFRDLKPANIMVDANDGHLRLIDFGISHRLGSGGAEFTPLGTGGYAPIEQLLDVGVMPDTRSDIYALGATLYHLLTGQVPPDARCRLVEEEFQPPSGLNPDVPAWLSDGVAHMLALRWEARDIDVMEVRTWIDHQCELARPRASLEIMPEQPHLPAVSAWWMDVGRQKRAIHVTGLAHHMLSFDMPQTHGDRLPKELWFEVPYHRQAVIVPIQLVKGRAEGGTMSCVAQLRNPPAWLLRALWDSLRPDIRHHDGQRRRVERVRVTIGLAVHDAPFQGMGGHVLDLSVDGIRVWTPQPLQLESVITLTLYLDDLVLPDLLIEGEVRWLGVQRGGGYEAGLQWIRLDPRTRDVVTLFLAGARDEQPRALVGSR